MKELYISCCEKESEKDDKTIHLACEFIRHHSSNRDSIGGVDCSELIERLKSLRPQPHWKPTKEQIDALNSIILNGSFTYVGQVQDLISLKDDLKKLM